jgi:hypothetical protein
MGGEGIESSPRNDEPGSICSPCGLIVEFTKFQLFNNEFGRQLAYIRSDK